MTTLIKDAANQGYVRIVVTTPDGQRSEKVVPRSSVSWWRARIEKDAERLLGNLAHHASVTVEELS